jgi:membrane protease YdiL (CAAX protease family)
MVEMENEVPWRISDAMKATVVLILISVPGFLASLLPFSGGRLTSASPLFSALVMALLESLLIFLAWFYGIRKYRIDFTRLGFHSFRILNSLFKGILWLIALKIFTAIYGTVAISVFGLKPPEELVQGIPDIFGRGLSGWLMAVFVVSVVAPIAEETFFRGFIYPAFRKRYGIGAGILISSLIFAVFHARVWLIIPVVAMGSVLAFLYEREKSLGPPIVLHALNNLLSVVIIYAQKG